MKKLSLAYSTNEEYFSGDGEYENYEEAALDCILENDSEIGDIVYVGKKEQFFPHIDASTVLENIGEQAYDEVGEAAESYLTNVKKEHEEYLEAALNSVLNKWLKKYKHNPYFFKVVKVKSFEVTEELLKKLNKQKEAERG